MSAITLGKELGTIQARRRMAPRPKYVSLALAAMQRGIAYRNSTIINLLTGLFWIASVYYLWHAVFRADPSMGATGAVGAYTWDRMRTYILVAYGVNTLLSFYTEARLFQSIRTGAVSMELLRPLDFKTAQLAEATGAAVIEGLIGALATLLLGTFVLHILGPASLVAALAFVVSVALGFLVKFHITYLTALLCFWTTNSIGLQWTRAAVTNVFSGALIPLAFFPDWLQTVAHYAPFQAIIATPLAIYLGEAHGLAILQLLVVQLAWVMALWALTRLAWGPCVRALTVQGG